MSNIAPEIFKAYDIRGIVETALTPATVELIGHAIGSEARERQLTTIAIGRDGRLSGPELAQALTNGIRKVESMSSMWVWSPPRCCTTPHTNYAATRESW